MKLKDFLKEIEHEYKYTECDVEDYDLRFVISGVDMFLMHRQHNRDISNLPITKYKVDSHNKQVIFYCEEESVKSILNTV